MGHLCDGRVVVITGAGRGIGQQRPRHRILGGLAGIGGLGLGEQRLLGLTAGVGQPAHLPVVERPALVEIAGNGDGGLRALEEGAQAGTLLEVAGFDDHPGIFKRGIDHRLQRLGQIAPRAAADADQPVAAEHADGKGLVEQPGTVTRRGVGIDADGGEGIGEIDAAILGDPVGALAHQAAVGTI